MMHAVQLNNLSRSDGSSILSSGETVVQAAVYGPSEIRVSKELYDKALIDVSYKRKIGQSDSTDRVFESFIRDALEPVILTKLHPRTSINIILQEVQDDGNMLACCVNSGCLALLDAGIPMNGVVAAICIGIFDDNIISFPSLKESKEAKCLMTVAVTNPGKNITAMKMSSFMSQNEVKKCIDVAKKNAEDIFKFYRETMQKRHKRTISR